MPFIGKDTLLKELQWRDETHGRQIILDMVETLKKGRKGEQARKVLPEGLTKTTLYMNGTLRSWIHYIDLRGANGTQKEHMEIARLCAEVIAKIFPMTNELTYSSP